MEKCTNNNPYRKFNETEVIEIGDLISLDPISNRVKLAFNTFKNKDNNIIGICNKIENNLIYVLNNGIINVNTTGIICLGDKLTSSNIKGKAKAINYKEDESQFKINSIGKVIGLYPQDNIVKVLLDLE